MTTFELNLIGCPTLRIEAENSVCSSPSHNTDTSESLSLSADETLKQILRYKQLLKTQLQYVHPQEEVGCSTTANETHEHPPVG